MDSFTQRDEGGDVHNDFIPDAIAEETQDEPGASTPFTDKSLHIPLDNALGTPSPADRAEQQRLRQLRADMKRAQIRLEIQETEEKTRLLLAQLKDDKRPQLPTRSAPAAAPIKRKASDIEEEDLRPLKTNDPPVYTGRTIVEHTRFIYACERTFRVNPRQYQSEQRRVDWAASFLRDAAQDSWRQHEALAPEYGYSWEEFKTFLLDRIQDPANRAASYNDRWFNAKQRDGQTVQAFAAWLTSLEPELTFRVDEAQRCARFLSALRIELRQAFDLVIDRPESFTKCVELAVRYEGRGSLAGTQATRGRGRGQFRGGRGSYRGGSYTAESTSSFNPNFTAVAEKNNRGESSSRAKGRNTGVKADVICYSCNGKGHYASACPSKGQSKNEKPT